MDKTNQTTEQRILRWIYGLTIFGLTWTGFAQMPIFKRYYIADIPGLGWSADFYFTHSLHYVLASVLLAFITFQAVGWFARARNTYSLTLSAWVRMAILAGIIVTGVFRVLKNMPNVVFSPNFTMAIDLTHLGLVMVFGMAALAFAIKGSGWLKEQEAGNSIAK